MAQSSENLVLEETIAEIYKTLQRNALKTSEIKKRNAQALEYSSTTMSRSGSRQSFISNPGSLEGLTSSNNFFSSQSLSHCPAHFFPPSMSNRNTTGYQLPKSTTFNTGNKEIRKTKVSPKKLRSYVFNTLDMIFHIKSRPSRHSQIPMQISKDLPKNENEPMNSKESVSEKPATDKIQRITPSIYPNLNNLNEEDDISITSEETTSERNIPDVISIISSSDDDNSWVYVDNPIHIQEVTMNDSNSPTSLKKINNLSKHEPTKSKPTHRYIRKISKGGASKIQRSSKRIKEIEANRVIKPETILLIDNPTLFKTNRPDSPIYSAGNISKRKLSSVSLSLSNLLETSIGENGDVPDFSTNSFSREISLRPSSTLMKSAPCLFPHNDSLSLIGNVECNDDDNSSSCTASSFSSMQIPDTVRIEQNAIVPVPSALCQHILVTPINVPIQPLKNIENVFRSKKISRKVSEAFVIDDGHACTPHSSGIKNEMDTIQDAFMWLDDLDRVQDHNSKENVPIEPKMVKGCETLDCGTRKNLSTSTSVCSTLNSSVPPPPPLPPPLPPQAPPNIGTTLRNRLPLAVFTKPTSGIFSRMENIIELREGDRQVLKEKFIIKGNKGTLGKRLKLTNAAETSRFQLNMELFLRKWNISAQNVDILINAINTLDAKPDIIDMTCISTLPIPKKEEMDRILHAKATRELNQAEAFMMKLTGISHLNEKLSCISFSVDFDDSTQKLQKRIESFTSACNSMNGSPKFIKIINVLVAFMRCLGADEGSQIYGFDIQSLSKLAMKTSEDGSTTLLHFLIEYLLNESSVADSIDFYLDFQDLSTVSKTSLKEITDQSEAYRKSLDLYKKEFKRIFQEKSHDKCSTKFATAFQKSADATLKEIAIKLTHANQAFKACKESYGLSNNAIVETDFFDSFHKFILAYRKIHMEVMERNKQISKIKKGCNEVPPSSKVSVKKAVQVPQRKPSDVNQLRKSTSGAVGKDELETRLFEVLDSKPKMENRPANRRRKSKTNIIIN